MFKAFFNIAKQLSDKVGMGFGLNRVACGLYYTGDFDAAVIQSQKCLELMDEDNMYASLYNMGVFHRKACNFRASIDSFEQVVFLLQQALEWALKRGDDESECLSLGQLAVSYDKKGDRHKALEYFERCRVKSRGIDNPNLELDCLMNTLKLREEVARTSNNQTDAPTLEEFQSAMSVAKTIGDQKTADKCKISMAVMSGDMMFKDLVRKSKVLLQ